MEAMTMPRPLNQQVVVISGAASGIGRATARRFAERGARLAVGGRSAAGVAAIVQEIKAAGAQGVGMEVDVSRRDQVEALAALAMQTYGRIDTWVNNAGVSIYGRFETISEAEARRLFDVNFFGTIHGMWTAIPLLRAQGGGTIINLASVVGKRGLPLQNFYSASKFAIIGLTESVRVEMKTEKANIALCAICPPSIDTPFYDNALSKTGFTAKPLPVVISAEAVAKDIVKFRSEHRAVRHLPALHRYAVLRQCAQQDGLHGETAAGGNIRGGGCEGHCEMRGTRAARGVGRVDREALCHAERSVPVYDGPLHYQSGISGADDRGPRR